MTHSLKKMAQQENEAVKKMDAAQMPVTIAKKGTTMPSQPTDPTINQVLIFLLLHLVFQSPMRVMLKICSALPSGFMTVAYLPPMYYKLSGCIEH